MAKRGFANLAPHRLFVITKALGVAVPARVAVRLEGVDALIPREGEHGVTRVGVHVARVGGRVIGTLGVFENWTKEEGGERGRDEKSRQMSKRCTE